MTSPSILSQSDIVDLVAGLGRFHVPSVQGNAGDSLIHFAMGMAFAEHGLVPEPFSPETALVIPGGGNLVPLWNARRFIEDMGSDQSGLILPHSMRGVSRLLRDRPNVRVIARELRTWHHLVDGGFPTDRLYLADDVAFWLAPWVASRTWGTSAGTLLALRADEESTDRFASLQDQSFDVSRMWVSSWRHKNETEAVATALLKFLSAFDDIVTDRLHVAIGAALLGKRCYMLDNSYRKNRGVYEFSIEGRYESVRWCKSLDDIPASVLGSSVGRAEAASAWRKSARTIGRPWQDLGIRAFRRLEPTIERFRRNRHRSSPVPANLSGIVDIITHESPDSVHVALDGWLQQAAHGEQLGIVGYWDDRVMRAVVDAFIDDHPDIDVRKVDAVLVAIC